MNFYRHYKNKPYTYVGIAHHSETLEELVIYETRYENPTGKVWVRPKNMFFENVEIDGKVIPRFEKVQAEIVSTTDISDAHLQDIAELMKLSFGEWDPNWFFSTFNNKKKVHFLLAKIDSRPVAFKLGYELDQKTFYSWIGGVAPEFRGLGIAKDLIQIQHDWCRTSGYERVQTKTMNRFRTMLALNIQQGFNVIGTHLDETGDLKIMLERKLS